MTEKLEQTSDAIIRYIMQQEFIENYDELNLTLSSSKN